MLFVSTRNPFYVLAGILSGSLAAVCAYFLFAHIRVRVHAWQDPFQDYQGGGYQICQSLFAISAGSWFGAGLCQGSPGAIPFVEQDMMFSAIAEELGSIFGICLILVCMSCFIMFVNISMQLTNRFYRLVAVGLGTTYATQIFLTVGGGIKLIPLTGVTFPLVSYGGSSMLSTFIMFAIVQGLYMLQRDEEVKNEQKRIMQEQQRFEQQMGNGYYGAYQNGAPYQTDGPYRRNMSYQADEPYRRNMMYQADEPYHRNMPYQENDYADAQRDMYNTYGGNGYEEGQQPYPPYEGGQRQQPYSEYDGSRYEYYRDDDGYGEYAP